ncbi:MAG: hypothetical protein AAGA95_07615 [Pseudomonadota bacterium]
MHIRSMQIFDGRVEVECHSAKYHGLPASYAAQTLAPNRVSSS